MRARAKRSLQVAELRTGQVAVDRALESMRQVVNQLAQMISVRAVLRAELVSGLNRLDHGLGSAPVTFGWVTDEDGAVVADAQRDNPFPARQLWVRLSGAPSANAVLLVY